MNAAVKLIIGLILVVIGVWLLVPATATFAVVKGTSQTMNMLDWSGEFLTVLKGSIPPLLILIGALVVWIESEELKAPEVPEIDEDFEIEEDLEEE